MRLSFETFASDAARALARLEELQDTLSQRDLPRDLEGARRLMEEHAALKKRATKASVEELDAQGRRLLQRLQSQAAGGGSSSESGYGNRTGGASGDSNDHHHGFHTHADAHNLVAKVTGLLDKLHGTRQNLQQLWHMRKLKLDQCFQLRLFEQDAEKVRALFYPILLYTQRLKPVEDKVNWLFTASSCSWPLVLLLEHVPMCSLFLLHTGISGYTGANLMSEHACMPVLTGYLKTLH